MKSNLFTSSPGPLLEPLPLPLIPEEPLPPVLPEEEPELPELVPVLPLSDPVFPPVPVSFSIPGVAFSGMVRSAPMPGFLLSFFVGKAFVCPSQFACSSAPFSSRRGSTLCHEHGIRDQIVGCCTGCRCMADKTGHPHYGHTG